VPAGDLFGKPVGGGGETTLHAARWQGQQCPAVPTATQKRFQHVPADSPEVGFERENIQLPRQIYPNRDRFPVLDRRDQTRSSANRIAARTSFHIHYRPCPVADKLKISALRM
jgi:hypothetical protein